MSTDEPTYEEVKIALRKALYSRDPIDRADATTQLAWWGLPANPDALSLAAERMYSEPVTRRQTA
jgi:hypothetical protein